MRAAVCVLLGTMAVTALATSPVSAAPAGVCKGLIVASARAPNGANFDPPRRYDTEKLARKRTVAAWRAKVRSECPRSSAFWWRAFRRTMTCEGYAGGVQCTASGVPNRKVFR